MAYFNNIAIKTADSPSIDAFARWRTSHATTLFDSKQINDTGSLNWNTLLAGNATASWLATACTRMIASGSATGVVRQTRRRFNYQPGKSQLIITTANLDVPITSAIKRVGYFDYTNGVFFMQSGSWFGIGLRNNGVDTIVSQSAWNLDTFDGTGPSGNTLNQTASQIYFMDLEWLGVGRVRYGIFQAGIPVYCHQITNVNALPNTNPTYMPNPNLPVRYELINSGSTSSSMSHICCAVISEGGVDITGPTQGIDLGSASIAIGTNNLRPLIALQLQSGYIDETVIPNYITVLPTQTSVPFRWSLLLNPTFTGSNNFVFQPIQNSAVQWATGSNSASITSEGYKLATGYGYGANNTVVELNVDPTIFMGSTVQGTTDTLVLAVQPQGVTGSFLGSIAWQETI